MKCLCGCGIEVDTLVRGQVKRYATSACRKRAERTRKAVTGCDIPVVTKPILKYPGAKWSRAQWIISHFPEHQVYLEPYCGSAAIFFNKSKVDHEILGDTSENITNFFTVLRTRGSELARAIALTPWSEAEYEMCEKYHVGTGDALEDARRFMVWCWQAHGTQLGKTKQSWRHRGTKGHSSTTEVWHKVPDRLLAAAMRLKDAEIRNRPALELIAYYNTPECLIYADPPYVLSTRKSTKHYQSEMSDKEHAALLQALLAHTGTVILSGYDNTLYDAYLPNWKKFFMPTVAEHGNVHMEVLWLNEKAQRRQMELFDEGMETA